MNDTESQSQSAKWQTCPRCKQSDFTDFHTCRYCETPYSGVTASGYRFPGTELSYATANDRALGFLIDNLIFYAIFYYVPNFRNPHNLPWLVALSWLYQATFISQLGGTIGQFALGTRMTTTEGEPVTFFRATLRFFASMVTALTGGLGNLMALGGKRQTLHDIISGCVLIEDDGQRHSQTSGRGGAILSLAVFLLAGAGLFFWQGKLDTKYAEMASTSEIGKSYYLRQYVDGAGDLKTLYEYADWRKQISGLFKNPLRMSWDDPHYKQMVGSRRVQTIYPTINKDLTNTNAGAQIMDVLKDNPTNNPVYRVLVLSGPQAGQQYWVQQKDVLFSAPYKIK